MDIVHKLMQKMHLRNILIDLTRLKIDEGISHKWLYSWGEHHWKLFQRGNELSYRLSWQLMSHQMPTIPQNTHKYITKKFKI